MRATPFSYQPADSGPIRLSVDHLALTTFRNYDRVDIATGGRSVILTGDNGAGKTNLLEGVSLLAPGRGMRGSNLAQLSRHSAAAEGWGVAATITGTDGEVRIGTGQLPGQADKRVIRVDGETLRSQHELNRHTTILWQTPQMDMLFTEGPSAKRRYFDRLVNGFDVEHGSRVARYDALRRERAKLLSFRHPDLRWLASIERKMAEASVAIASARLEGWEALTLAMQDLHAAFPQARLRLLGEAEEALATGNASALVIEDRLAERLAGSRPDDATSGRASSGAHRMELDVMHIGKGTEASICSTGEQKALLLSLLLAQAAAIKNREGRVPILLLDEVVAHLDAARRSALFETLQALDAQCWLTGTDAGMFGGMQNTNLWRVEKGRVSTD